MKKPFIAPGPIYVFLSFCNDSPLEREVLDCGAGGSSPPLALFHEHGYKTHGIDISDAELKKAQQFCVDHGVELNIAKGDMRDIPFGDESMSFVYSYSAICHMTKSDVVVAMREITRVLKKGGICFVNFCAVADRFLTEDQPREPGEYSFEEHGEEGVHSVFGDDEPDQYFRDYTLLRKEKRQIENYGEQKDHGWAELLYFARKQ